MPYSYPDQEHTRLTLSKSVRLVRYIRLALSDVVSRRQGQHVPQTPALTSLRKHHFRFPNQQTQEINAPKRKL